MNLGLAARAGHTGFRIGDQVLVIHHARFQQRHQAFAHHRLEERFFAIEVKDRKSVV